MYDEEEEREASRSPLALLLAAKKVASQGASLFAQARQLAAKGREGEMTQILEEVMAQVSESKGAWQKVGPLLLEMFSQRFVSALSATPSTQTQNDEYTSEVESFFDDKIARLIEILADLPSTFDTAEVSEVMGIIGRVVDMAIERLITLNMEESTPLK